ncbi:Mss4-like protein [Pilobolus umbonatus]|nr:Mss4-like protein [Pilobolus umbonatus]
MTSYSSIQDPLTVLVTAQNKNTTDILCPRETCDCVIFRKQVAERVTRDGTKLQLPSSTQPLEDEFWIVKSMMDFENAGFSQTVGTIKYLSCADCDIGPLGYHDTTQPNEFLISMKRARYRI